MRLFLSLALLLVLALPAHAAFEGPGSQAAVTKAVQVQDAADNASCALEGNIVEKVTGSDDKYMFKDASGTVLVDIDHKIFAGHKVTPTTKIRIEGKVDKDMGKTTKVDVKVMEILK